MNYLKKKINKAVGNPKRKNNDDDDDEFNNYVPEIPPHPSTLISDNNNNNNFANFDSIDKIKSELSTIINNNEQLEKQKEQLSIDELKLKEEEYRKEEREKLRKQEESKKDCEEWKFFLSLTAKVDAVTSKTQTILEKLQTDSAVKEISKFEDPTFSDQFDETAPKTSGSWAAFDENSEYNPSDPIFKTPKQDDSKLIENSDKNNEKQQEIDEGTKKIAQELINDFGFTNLAPGISKNIDTTATTTNISLIDDQPAIDPFDTSFIDIEALRSGELISKPTLIKDIDVDEIDPFDTSYIESTIQKDLTIKD